MSRRDVETGSRDKTIATEDPMLEWTHELVALPRRPARILVFIAMRGEAEPVGRAIGVDAEGRGMVGDAEIRLVVPGADRRLGIDRIGPSYAAWSLTRAVATQRPDLVVNLGTAGGFESRGLRIADLVLARDTMFHDARVALPGFDALARAHARLSPGDAQLDRLAAATDSRPGLVSSGASLDATPAEMTLFDDARVLAKDMELAALASVCLAEDLPLVALKGVTDLVDHAAGGGEPTHEAFVRNLARTCDRLAAAAPTLLRALGSER